MNFKFMITSLLNMEGFYDVSLVRDAIVELAAFLFLDDQKEPSIRELCRCTFEELQEGLNEAVLQYKEVSACRNVVFYFIACLYVASVDQDFASKNIYLQHRYMDIFAIINEQFPLQVPIIAQQFDEIEKDIQIPFSKEQRFVPFRVYIAMITCLIKDFREPKKGNEEFTSFEVNFEEKIFVNQILSLHVALFYIGLFHHEFKLIEDPIKPINYFPGEYFILASYSVLFLENNLENIKEAAIMLKTRAELEVELLFSQIAYSDNVLSDPSKFENAELQRKYGNPLLEKIMNLLVSYHYDVETSLYTLVRYLRPIFDDLERVNKLYKKEFREVCKDIVPITKHLISLMNLGKVKEATFFIAAEMDNLANKYRNDTESVVKRSLSQIHVIPLLYFYLTDGKKSKILEKYRFLKYLDFISKK